MTAGWQNKYSIGSSNSDGYEEETHGPERVGIHVYIHTHSRPSTLSARSPHDNKRRCARSTGPGGQAGRAPLLALTTYTDAASVT